MIRPSQNRDGRFFEGARDPADRVGGEGLEAARASMIGEITKRARVTEQGMTNCPHPTVMRRRQWPFRASSPNRSSRLMLDDAALVAPHHSAVSGGSSNVRTANRFLRRELANARMKPPRPTGAWPARPRTPFCARSSSTVDDIGSEPEFLALYAAFSRLAAPEFIFRSCMRCDSAFDPPQASGSGGSLCNQSPVNVRRR